MGHLSDRVLLLCSSCDSQHRKWYNRDNWEKEVDRGLSWKNSPYPGKKPGACTSRCISRKPEYAQYQGSQNAKRYYANISTLANKAAGIEDDNRDNATMSQLGRLILIENVISDCIRHWKRQQAPYKGTYRKCRERIEQFGAIAMIA